MPHQYLSPFRQRPRLGAVPSLPAGINRDDSDPAWGRIVAWDIEPLFGAAGDPRFGGGGRYRPPLFSSLGTAGVDEYGITTTE